MKMRSAKVIFLGLIFLYLFLLTGGSNQVYASDDNYETIHKDRIDKFPIIKNISRERIDGSWWDGQVEFTWVINYLGYAENGFGTWVGYWQNVELGHPRVGELYLVKVAVYGVGSPASGQQVAVINFMLPPNTQIDTNTYAIRCFGGPDMLEFTGGCPQLLPYDNLNGTFNIPSGEYGNVWPVAPGAGWEFWIPVKTSTTLSGDYFIGVIDNIEAMNTPDILNPTVPIYVFTTTAPPGEFNKMSPANDSVNVPIDTYLEWGDSSNFSTYEYCIDTSNDNSCTPWVDWTISFDILSPGTTYYWHIRAINSGGVTYSNGSPTAFWSFTTQEATTAPGAFGKVTPINGAEDMPTNPTLSWEVSNGAKSYEYCYDTTNDAACFPWENIGLVTSKTLTGLATDTIYYWHVRAVNDVGTTYADGSHNTFWSFTTAKPTSPPGTFSKASPSDSAMDIPISPVINWGPSSGATSYEYCIDTSNDDVCSSWVSVGADTSRTLIGLAANTTYYWHVRARNSDGVTYANRSESAFWSFKTAVPISADDGVLAIAVQGDNKILIGGYFNEVNGVTRHHIARLHPDGSLDTSFSPNINGRVDAIAIQPDGKILVGGDFTFVNTLVRLYIARLNFDGSVDNTFFSTLNAPVYSILIQPDGKILIGGAFSVINTLPRTFIARLNKDGALDSSFDDIILDNIVRTLALQADGKILLGGAFKYVNSERRTHIARLLKDGALDDSFIPDFDNYLMNIVIQPDGMILVGGQFVTVNGEPHKHIARLEPSGKCDDKFFADADDSIVSIALQADGKIILGGYFTKVNEEIHNHLVRLDSSGIVDNSLALDTNGLLVNSVGLQSNGRILIGGDFTLVNGSSHQKIARLLNNLPATQSLSIIQGSSDLSISWELSHASPSAFDVTFELSTDGTNFTLLGHGDYSLGAWILNGQDLPFGKEIWIRARGYYSSGQFNGSGSILEEVMKYYCLFLPLIIK